MKHKSVFLLVILLLGISASQAQYKEYDSHIYLSKQGDSLLYRQLNPQKITKGTKYPLVLFLHGAGERGSDNVSQLRNGAMMFTNPINREHYPCFVIFPQCPTTQYWPAPKRPDNFKEGNPFPLNAEITKPLGLAKELLDSIVRTEPIDTDRIYIVGISMGGMGTMDMVCRFPDVFAAAIPICGGVNTKRLDALSSKTGFRIFHGDADTVIPVEFSREAYLILKAKRMEVEYFEFAGAGHACWDQAFNKEDFMSWLFQHKRRK
ncbi:prolyl oligopeptidase family serine peptidase [Porphyromonas pogonae]|uniref:carboxylesterase family protein n=1 Tax=Porphyromonas pogonae TaxID=867595 RepID=UPI002E793E45|nr:prolyl oligopeptidase family serine peptidase [Porphyromonas pogonae]